MKRFLCKYLRSSWLRSPLITIGFILLLAAPAFAQGTSAWENAVNVLMTAFTSTIARGLSLVAIVVAGLTFAFGQSRPTSLIRSMSSSKSSAGLDADTFPKSI
jgi:type IV secretory pathway VirB2 component (pilin)